ncbi:MAG: N-acetylmuramoyl-L-alanine amidase [Firmicutes bacterium]|nr:N-acetylmuramoyl-L-alanine amidase [Bacillota bacterium]MCL1953750.1 N-acetylmuramoyl-L-alanine amidase [Bacillota bacterium]
MATVVLDAGHGGTDPGATLGNRREADDNLRLTLAIGNILAKCGVNVLYTRTTDTFITLGQRSVISNNAGANLFVSLHRNSSDNPNANGFEVHVYTNPDKTSLNLASNIMSRIANTGIQGNRGILNSNFSVLRQTNAPSVLVESNFISNVRDNELFDANFDDYANAIANGIIATLGISCDGSPSSPAQPGTLNPNTVANIQQVLNNRYNTGIIADGIWGPVSQRALLRGLQQQLNLDYRAGLATDGLWGPRTKSSIPILRDGDRGNLVYLLQAALYVRGYNTVPDGIFGSNTRAAVMQLQRNAGLSADGLAGPNTFAALFG